MAAGERAHLRLFLFSTLLRVCLIWFIINGRRVDDGLGAGAFLCHKTSARSRDGAESRPPLFLTIEYARINPKAHGGWHLRARTLDFQNPRPSAREPDPTFNALALRLLAFSKPLWLSGSLPQ